MRPLAYLSLLSIAAFWSGASAAAPAATPLAVDLRFEPNRGQFDARPDYRVRGAGYALFLARSGPVLRLGAAGLDDGVLRVELEGASAQRH